MTNTQASKISSALAAGAARFFERFPEVDGIQLDTVRHFAQERFLKATTDEILSDPRFEVEGPAYYYRLMVGESLTLAHAVQRVTR